MRLVFQGFEFSWYPDDVEIATPAYYEGFETLKTGPANLIRWSYSQAIDKKTKAGMVR